MSIDFVDQDVPRLILPDVSHCLFRVVQEALQNAIRHSGAKHVEVQLRGGKGEVHLIVRDSGVGFDVRKGLNGRGLGLTSMRERVRLVNGTIVLRSKPSAGTDIHVCVPLMPEPE